MVKTLSKSCVFLVCLVACAGARAQEDNKTPSQKTKAAVEKPLSVPATISENPQRIGESVGAKHNEPSVNSTGSNAKSPLANEKTMISQEELRSSPMAKRDPFRPFTLNVRPNIRRRENLSPLERYEFGQLKLVGVIWDVKEPRAMVEDSAGLGYVVKVGTAIGVNDGKVKTISSNAITIEEFYVDLYGARKRRDIEMRLPREKSE
jgi:type IV pilus assembly protein PilP